MKKPPVPDISFEGVIFYSDNHYLNVDNPLAGVNFIFKIRLGYHVIHHFKEHSVHRRLK